MKKQISTILLLLLVAQPLQAANFNPNNIISDTELEEYNSLSEDSIQRFLESKDSFLAKFTQVVNGVRKKASKIIWVQ